MWNKKELQKDCLCFQTSYTSMKDFSSKDYFIAR